MLIIKLSWNGSADSAVILTAASDCSVKLSKFVVVFLSVMNVPNVLFVIFRVRQCRFAAVIRSAAAVFSV